MRLRFASAILVLLGVFAASSDVRAQRVQLELVLAVDVSLSVSTEEFNLQAFGLAEAFRHEAVIGAIRSVGDNGIAVSLIQWSDNNQQTVAVDWAWLTDRASAEAFTGRIARMPRRFDGAGTAISRALEASFAMFWRNSFIGDRKVVDISGDGIDNRGPTPQKWRDIAASYGVTVNGLAILNEDKYLDRYYANNVIGGTGAFVIAAADYEDFADAIIRKLIQEISGVPVAEAPGSGADTAPRIAHGPAPHSDMD
jgi:hypothetical protein